MEVTYHLTRKDMLNMQFGYLFRYPIMYLPMFVVFLLVFLAVFTYLQLNSTFSVIAAVVLAGLELVLIIFVNSNRALKGIRFYEIPVTFTNDDYGIRLSNEKGYITSPWHKVTLVERMPGFIVVMVSSAANYLIPDRAFPSKSEADTYFTTLKTRWEEKKGIPPGIEPVQEQQQLDKNAGEPVSVETKPTGPVKHLDYTLKYPDVFNFSFRLYFFKPGSLLLFFLALLLLIISSLLKRDIILDPSFDLITTLLTIIPILVIVVALLRLLQISMVAKNYQKLGRLTRYSADFNETGFTLENEYFKTTSNWELTSKIERKGEYIALFTNEAYFNLIPPSAFSSSEERNEFFTFISNAWKKANEDLERK